MAAIATDVRTAVIDVGRTWATSHYELTRLAAELDDSGEWAMDGAITAAHWIATQLDIEVCTAREWVRIGQLLRTLPAVAARFADGRLSYSKVRALTRVANPQNEAELCELAQSVPAGRLNQALAGWSARNDDPGDIERRHHRERSFFCRVEADGMVSGSFRLPPLEGANLTGALDAVVMRGAATECENDASAVASHPSLAQQRADALVALATGDEAAGAIETEIVIHVRGGGCELDDGTPITQTTVESIAPQSFIRTLIHDADNRPINASSRRRHPSTRQRRVVKERDRRCRDCGTQRFLEYDHVPSFDQSHRTLVDELQLRCSRCHRRRHASVSPELG